MNQNRLDIVSNLFFSSFLFLFMLMPRVLRKDIQSTEPLPPQLLWLSFHLSRSHLLQFMLPDKLI